MRTLKSMSRRRLTAYTLLTAVLGTLVAATFFAWGQGYRLYVVETGSMSPTYQAGDVVVDRTTDAGYEPGDVLTMQISAAGDLVTHRMTQLDARGQVHTKGDANEKPDAWALDAERIRGVVEGHVPKLGYLIVFLRQPTGVAGVMTSALSVVLLWGICFPQQSQVRATEPVPARQPLIDEPVAAA